MHNLNGTIVNQEVFLGSNSRSPNQNGMVAKVARNRERLTGTERVRVLSVGDKSVA